MADKPVEGLDPEELEEQASALEELIAAALAVTAVAAVAQVFIPGMPGLPSVDGLGVITDLWWPRVNNDLLPELEKLTIRSAQALASGINRIKPPDLPAVNIIPDVTAAQILSGARNRLVAIGDDLWANARASMVQGLEQGETIPELAARVRAAAGVTEPRARLIARTEVIGASNGASIAQARSAGYQMKKAWQATEDPRTRLWHREADGQEVPLNGMFQVGGELLDYPGDPRGRADNVCNCRCAIRYVIDFGGPVVATAGALHRPGLNCCRGQDGLPVHKGPCRGTAKKATPAKADRPSAKERASERAFDQMVKSALPNRGRERRLAEPKPVDAAVARQAQIDAVRSKADLLAELEETAIINQADPAVVGRTVAAAVKRLGLADDPDVARLMPAVTSGDPEQIATAIADAASRLGLRRIGGDSGQSLQVVPFDRKTHEAVGDPLRPGQFAEVVRPGWWIDLLGETPKVLTRARVTETDERPAAEQPSLTASRVENWLSRSAALAAPQKPESVRNLVRFGAQVDLETYPDGSQAIRKRADEIPEDYFGTAISGKFQADAEQLASLVGASLGLKVPGIHRVSDDTVLMEFMDGEIAASLPDDGAERLRAIPDGTKARIGLFDALIDNVDRNVGNFLFTPDADPALIDHGVAWQFDIGDSYPAEDPPILQKEFGSFITQNTGKHGSIYNQYVPNIFTPADMGEVKRRLESLRPEFDRLGRGDWLNQSLARLAGVAEHASGTKDVIV